MNPQKLILTVRAAYKSFDTYSDVGRCTPDGADPIQPLEFKTFFKRPDQFRFQWFSYHPFHEMSAPRQDFALWTNGTQFKHQYFDKTENVESLSMLVAGATGISRTSVNKILLLLLPKSLEMKRYWQEMTDVRMLEEEVVNEVDCYHLQGTSKTVDDIEVWIEKNSLLIRRIKEKVVTTEEDCREINNRLQSLEQLTRMREMMLEKGMKSDQIEFTLNLLKDKPKMTPSSTCYVFDYLSVKVNEPVDTRLFEAL